MRAALERSGFDEVSFLRLPLVFRCLAGAFAEHFRNFAARAAVILDRQDDAVLKEIHSSWETQLEAFLVDGELRVPMPALAVSAVCRG